MYFNSTLKAVINQSMMQAPVRLIAYWAVRTLIIGSTMHNAQFTNAFLYNAIVASIFNSTISSGMTTLIADANFPVTTSNYVIEIVNAAAKAYNLTATNFATVEKVQEAVQQAMQLFTPFTAIVFPGEELEAHEKVICQDIYTHNIIKKAVFNKAKYGFCMTQKQVFLATDTQKIKDDMAVAFEGYNTMLQLKSTFYCASCSKGLSAAITTSDPPTITVPEKFCDDFVAKFKDYIRWRFVTFKSYAAQLSAYAKCFKTDGDMWNPNYLIGDPLPQLYPGITDSVPACLQSPSYANCKKLCGEISLSGYSAFLDGDKTALTAFYNDLINVLRVHGVFYGTSIQGQPDPSDVVVTEPAAATNTTATTTEATPPPARRLRHKRILEQVKKTKRVKRALQTEQ